MRAERWRKVEDLYHAALERAAADRGAFLDQACAGDAELREEVESLLEAHESPGGLLDSTALDAAARSLAEAAPGLAKGDRLGAYEIVSRLGIGGMGEVWRARDSGLGRDVAIKMVLPGRTADPDQVRRFVQEARAAGMLNHPGILAVYAIGERAGMPYLVSEMLEGQTLREKLQGGALTPRKALDYAIQIAQGLAAAHDKGMVHRDLKPENLFVTPEGRVKILDFGLAKLKRQPSGCDAVHTESGMVMGTPSYMSPELVRAQEVDHRSDIFSLGAILHEMLTGRQAFARETPVETMNAVLQAEPPPLEGVPFAVSQIVTHCLEKAREERYHSARDLAFQLSAAREPSGAAAPPAPLRATRRRLVMAGLATAGVGVAGFWGGRISVRARQPIYRQLTFRRGAIWSARFASDGRTVVYSAEWDGEAVEVFVGSTDTPESKPLGYGSASLLSIGRGSELALMLRPNRTGGVARGVLARVPLTGGGLREVLPNVMAADWSPSGAELAIVRRAAGACRLEYPAGNVLGECQGWYDAPRFSPDGKWIAVLEHPLGESAGAVLLIDPRSKRKVTLSPGWDGIAGLAWTEDGREVFFAASTTAHFPSVHAVSLRGARRDVLRQPTDVSLRDLSREGKLLLSRDSTRLGIVLLDRRGGMQRDLSWFDTSFAADVSSVRGLVLFTDMMREPSAGVYIRETDGSPATRLGDGLAVALSPDGRWALAISRPDDDTLIVYATGAGESRRIGGGLRYRWGSWLADNRRILVTASESGRRLRVFLVDGVEGVPRPVTAEGTIFDYRSQAVAPGADVFFARDPSGAYGIYGLVGRRVQPVNGLRPGESPLRWCSDGRTIFVQSVGELPARLFQLDPATGQRKLWSEFSPPDRTGIVPGRFVPAPDGSAALYQYWRDLSELYLTEFERS